ncbi:UDP-N-acetylmuramoyl-L-alanine--D-glutamate ligase [Bacillus horti]|uniref:UDP-N-acetylmuramoylalanine--D-glutamate ligase n=1 Tax=Caldalkalibacillus horti TaxID=77523 RepID=A0ABT9VUE2_9BACI|nr:UDP-N-acetylmuramoyl-L-alanine--D-glutamate ligase [Bacillus horti]MDQ0164605.1 UDP-N-acetylmuramoylalanine--D-glutamate ligase [Bacillus horti]
MNKAAFSVYKDKLVLVVGLAKSGSAVAKLLFRLGASVIVNDRNAREECAGIEELENLGIQVVCGSHPLELLDRPIDLIVKNPGIPFDIPFLAEAEQRGISVITEVEIASCISEAPIIGITGSNGKTTTTTMIHLMLQGGKYNPLIAGNIGTVMCEVTEQATNEDIIVAELSSFQLLGTASFRPKIGLLLNIHEAHLNYHHTMEHYTSAKLKLFANQDPTDLAVLNADQDFIRQAAAHLQAEVAWFSTEQEVHRGSFIRHEGIIYRDGQGDEIEILPLSELLLPGRHNVQNALAAITVSLAAGAELTRVQEVLKTFRGVEHRLKFVATKAGVHYYNDSKATNATATINSIQAFQNPLLLIAGGLDRGEDLSPLEPILTSHVKTLIAYGQLAPELKKAAQSAGLKQVYMADTVEDAVNTASLLAQQGDTVLLSPAAASWDQFRSFEERGDMFIRSVHKLK